MLVDYDAVVDYLLTQELVFTENIVSNDLIVTDASRRNSNIIIIREAGPCYFLKQEIRDQEGADGKFATVAYEAEIYQLFQSIQGHQKLLRYLLRYYRYDAHQRILILEGIPGSISLVEVQFRRGRANARLAGQLGKALATLHKVTAANRQRFERIPGIPTTPPWVFYLDQPDQWIYLNSSASNLEFVRILQQSTNLCEGLERLRRQWHTESLIHGDLKWDNCILSPDVKSRPAAGIKIIDWELAQIGDPCWDVGAIFAGYLAVWLSSIPLSGEAAPDQYLTLARFPLRKIKPAILAFWNAYIHGHEIAPVEAADRMLRATQYAGLWLVQTAYERLQGEAGITPQDICILQLCENMVMRPMEAAVHLLGLPLLS